MIITLGGRYGSGGKRIAKLLSEDLGYRICDDEIISEAVKNSDINMEEETFRYFDESQGTASLSEIRRLSSIQRSSYLGAVSMLSLDVMPLDRKLGLALNESLNKLADKGNCIMLGRCADYYLAGRDDLLSIFVIDDEENCVARVIEFWPDMSEKEAKKLIKRTNRRREDYYEFFTHQSWGDMDNYSIVLNCARVGSADRAAAYLSAAIRSRTADARLDDASPFK